MRMSIKKLASLLILFLALFFLVFSESIYSNEEKKYDPKTEQSFNKNTIKEEISKTKDIIEATKIFHKYYLDNRFKAAIYTAEQIKSKFGDKAESYYLYLGLLGRSYVMTGDVNKAIEIYKIDYQVANYPNGISNDKENTDDYKMSEWIHVINKLYECTYYKTSLMAEIYKYSMEFKKKFPKAPPKYNETPDEIIRIYEESQNEKKDYEIKKALVEDFFKTLSLIIVSKDKVKLKDFLDSNSFDNDTCTLYYNFFIDYYFIWDIKELKLQVSEFEYSKKQYNNFGYAIAYYQIKSEPDIEEKIRMKLKRDTVKWALSFKFSNNTALLFY